MRFWTLMATALAVILSAASAEAQRVRWYVPAVPYYGSAVYPGLPPYHWYYGTYDPTWSDVIRARGEAARNWSQALINYEQARSRYIENRQRWLETYLERKRLAESYRAEQYARERESSDRYLAARRKGTAPAFDATQIDVTTGRISWPEALQSDAFAAERHRVEEALVLLAHTGSLSSLATEVATSARQMREDLKARIREVPAHEYIPAKRFVEALAHLASDQHARGQLVETSVAEPATPSLSDLDVLTSRLDSQSLAEQHEAVTALGRLGSAAQETLPDLLRLLDRGPTILRHSVIETLGSMGSAAESTVPRLRALLKDRDPLIRVAAARALVRIRPDDKAVAAQAVPVLIAALRESDRHLQSEARAALADVGEAAIPATIGLLRGTDPDAAKAAADVLAEIGPVADAAVPELLSALGHRDSEVRWRAARALGNVGGQPQHVVPELAQLLRDDSPVVRAHAAYAVGRYGRDAAPVVPTLAEALGDTHFEVRIAAARALCEIGPAAQAAVSALVRALYDSSGAVTLDAADALVRIGAPAVPALIQSLNEPPLAGLVANALGQVGPPARVAVPALVRLIDSADDETRREAILALAAIGPAANEAAPRLVKLLETPEEPFRAGAAYALAMVEADEAVPLLKQGLTSGDELLELASAWGLLHLDPENEAYTAIVVPRLSRALTHERPLVRLKAAEAAAELGPRAKAALPALIAALADDQFDLRVQVLDALAAMGPDAASSVSAITPLLDADEPVLRTAAANALGRIGPASRSAIPSLERMLRRRDPFERTVAASALIRIDPRPEFVRAATPLMIAALKDERPEVRVEAATVLGMTADDNAAVRTALQEAMRDEDETVRTAAQRALRQL